MKKYIVLFILVSSCLLVKAQEPTGFPTQFNTGWQQWGYQQSIKGTIIATRDTNWAPRYCGTMVLWPHASVDTAYWMWDCVKWKKLTTAGDITAPVWGSITGTLSNQTDLQNAFNLKLNISDTTNKWWGIGKRWADSVYRVNDSTVGYSINGSAYTFQILGRLSSGGGGINNVNIGSGFRPVNAITQEMKTYFAGFGQRLDSVANANGLTWSSDTTRGSGLPSYFYTDSLFAASHNISNTALTANGNYGQNWNNKVWYVDSIGSSFLFRMGGVGAGGTRRKEFRINWGGSSSGDQFDGFNILASIKKADLSADSLTMGLMSSGTGVLSIGAYNIANSINNTFISYHANAGLINISAKDSIWIKGAIPAATADSILGVIFRGPGVSKIVKIPLTTGAQNIVDTVNKYLPIGTIYSTSYYLASASQIGLDSTWVLVSQGGDVHFKRREGGVYVDKAILSIEDDIIVSDSVPFVGPTWDASGDSYTAGVGASPSGNAYVPLLETNMSMTANNDGESGTGIMDVQFKSYRDYAPFGQENRNPRTLMIGFNDYLKSNDGSRTQIMFPYAFRAVLFNHFLDTALASNDPGLTTTGSWSTFDLSASYPQKSKYLLSGTGRLSVASSAGDSKSYTFDGENVGIIFLGANGTTQDYGRFKVEIDGMPVDTVDENGIADNQSVFANSATRTEDLVSAAVVYTGLSNGSHTIKATLLDNKNTNLDAFGVMSNAPSSQSLVVGSIQKLLSAGYTAMNGSFPKNDAGVDATNTIIQAVVNEFRLIGYKVVLNDVNAFTDPSTDIGVDNIHWNNSGHAKGKDSFRSKIIR